MKLIYESSEMKPYPNAISALVPMGGAKICLDDIQHDETAGIVRTRMKRREFLGWKKSFLFGKEPVSSEPRIETLLTIGDVVTMNMEVDDRLINECNSCFTVLIGLHVNNNVIFISSLEEASGVTLCHIAITVRKINIEFVDIETLRERLKTSENQGGRANLQDDQIRANLPDRPE